MSQTTKEQKKARIMQESLKLFSKEGFYTTTIPDIARALKMSVGNLYNYFTSKEALAKELIMFISKKLGFAFREINNANLSSAEKIKRIVTVYFTIAENEPEVIEYFLRVYLSNREVFSDGCEGMICVSPFVTEVMVFFEEGVAKGELRDQDFFTAFGLFMGYLGGMVFLYGERMLPNKLAYYIDDISNNIYLALKSNET